MGSRVKKGVISKHGDMQIDNMVDKKSERIRRKRGDETMETLKQRKIVVPHVDGGYQLSMAGRRVLYRFRARRMYTRMLADVMGEINVAVESGESGKLLKFLCRVTGAQDWLMAGIEFERLIKVDKVGMKLMCHERLDLSDEEDDSDFGDLSWYDLSDGLLMRLRCDSLDSGQDCVSLLSEDGIDVLSPFGLCGVV